jgi:hypothetical protein
VRERSCAFSGTIDVVGEEEGCCSAQAESGGRTDHPSNDAVAITRIDPFRICPDPDSSHYNFVETQRVTLFELSAGLIRNGYRRGIGSMVHTASEVDGPLKSGSSKSDSGIVLS